MNKVLVIAVHPDDETLGCGGTLLKHKAAGDEIHWMVCTSVEKEDPSYQIREEQIKKVNALYGFDSYHNMELNTMRVDEYSISTLIDAISKVIHTLQPNILYLPFKSDVHSDHRKIFEAAYSCTKSFRYSFIKKIYMMETLSETEYSVSTKEDSFIPNVFVNISPYLDKKIDIMNTYKSELGIHPFPRSIENIRALATFRGATCGHFFAEAFMLLKEIAD